MKQNIYDDATFFQGYKELRDNDTGLNGVLEEPAFRSLLPDLRGKAILDLGCGMGNFAVYAMERGAASYIGVDISRNMIEVARKRVIHSSVAFINGPIEDHGIESSQYDLIVSSLCLHYIEDYEGVIVKIVQGLKPGGMFAFSVEHPVCTASIKDQLWCEAADGTKRHWILDDYRCEGLRKTAWFVEGVTKYHRTTETYVNGLISQGLTLIRLLEPAATNEAIAKRPDLADQARRPPFLLIAAVKKD